MRKLLVICVALACTLGLVGAATAGASTPQKKPPVKLKGKVTNKGTKSVKGGKIKIKVSDFSFEPTFIKGKPGETVKVTLTSTGSAPHTFTADDGSFDEQLSPGDKVTVDVTIPTNGKPLTFHCNFHGDRGMKGAFFSKAGSSSGSGTTATTATGGGNTGY